MCGRFSIAVRIGYIAERFGVPEPQGLNVPMYNIAPRDEVPVISAGSGLSCCLMTWGLVPSFAKEVKNSVIPINARAETIHEKTYFKGLLGKGRCIIPATGFYEWKKTDTRKQPFYFRMRNRELFGMAGLCDSRKSPLGEITWSFTIITTSPNSLVLPVHTRMPAILGRKGEKDWLDHDLDFSRDLSALLGPFNADHMEAYPVTSRVNSPLFKSEAAVVEERTPGNGFLPL